jgi:hypothetical protein
MAQANLYESTWRNSKATINHSVLLTAAFTLRMAAAQKGNACNQDV